jgi:transposase
MRRFVAEDLVFLDESIFNEMTRWQYHAYDPRGQDIRYLANTQRGRTWSICAATTIRGWHPCTGVKEGYFKTPDLINWLRTGLLPALQQESLRPRVIVMDNNSTHIDSAVTEAIEAEGHIVRFLPPYSPDFNPIELSFSVLKAWFQRNYIWTRSNYRDFGQYLVWAISHSRCGQFVREQFRHAASGLYLEEGEYERFQKWLRDWETAEATEENEWTEEDLQEVEEDLQELEAE